MRRGALGEALCGYVLTGRPELTPELEAEARRLEGEAALARERLLGEVR